MFNGILFVLFLGYIFSLLIGFSIKNHSKYNLNKKYHHYKFSLLLMICLIFIFVSMLILTIQEFIDWFFYILIINGVFIIYMLSLLDKKTRCWKQHRMVIYNFFSIPVIYLTSLLLEQPLVLLGVLLIYIYTIIEFQFAKFNHKKPFLWD